MTGKAMRPLLALAVGVTMLGACDGVNNPGAERVSPGVLQLIGGPAPSVQAGDRNEGLTWTLTPGDGTTTPYQVLTAPDTVSAGVPFEVLVQTIGDGGCWSAQRQDVVVDGRTVELRPYDAHSGADVCTMILLYLAHNSTLTLDEPGVWTLRVSGRRIVSGGAEEVGVSAEKRIVVR
jgi:hypothetical protein